MIQPFVAGVTLLAVFICSLLPRSIAASEEARIGNLLLHHRALGSTAAAGLTKARGWKDLSLQSVEQVGQVSNGVLIYPQLPPATEWEKDIITDDDDDLMNTLDGRANKTVPHLQATEAFDEDYVSDNDNSEGQRTMEGLKDLQDVSEAHNNSNKRKAQADAESAIAEVAARVEADHKQAVAEAALKVVAANETLTSSQAMKVQQDRQIKKSEEVFQHAVETAKELQGDLAIASDNTTELYNLKVQLGNDAQEALSTALALEAKQQQASAEYSNEKSKVKKLNQTLTQKTASLRHSEERLEVLQAAQEQNAVKLGKAEEALAVAQASLTALDQLARSGASLCHVSIAAALALVLATML